MTARLVDAHQEIKDLTRERDQYRAQVHQRLGEQGADPDIEAVERLRRELVALRSQVDELTAANHYAAGQLRQMQQDLTATRQVAREQAQELVQAQERERQTRRALMRAASSTNPPEPPE